MKPNKPSLKRLFIVTIITSLVVSALVGIVVLLQGSFDATDRKILGTTLVLGLFSITSLANLRTLDSPSSGQRVFSVVSILVSLAAFLMCADIIWAESFFNSDAPWRTTATLIILAVSSAHASLLLPMRARGGWINIAVTTTLGMIAVVAGMLIYLVFRDYEYDVSDPGCAGYYFGAVVG
jgi:hypothetical protein